MIFWLLVIYIYIHQSSQLYHQHALYIKTTRIFHEYIRNPSQIHQSLLLHVQHHKFNIPTVAVRTAAVWPPGVQRRVVDAISCQWHGSRIVWTHRQRLHKRGEITWLHKRGEITCVRLNIEKLSSTSLARGGFQPTRNNSMKTDNPNGAKVKNHSGTKADNANDMNTLNIHTHRREVSNQSWSWQLHLDT